MGKSEKMKLEEELKRLNGEKTLLVVSENTQMDANAVVKYLMKRKKLSCIYICLNKPQVTIEQIFGKLGLDKRRAFFIDCITLAAMEKAASKKNVMCIPTPADLTGMSTALQQLAPIVAEHGFVIIDALRTMLIYNRAKDIASFIRSLNSLATTHGMRVIAFTTTTQDELFQEVVPLFDRVLETT